MNKHLQRIKELLIEVMNDDILCKLPPESQQDIATSAFIQENRGGQAGHSSSNAQASTQGQSLETGILEDVSYNPTSGYYNGRVNSMKFGTKNKDIGKALTFMVGQNTTVRLESKTSKKGTTYYEVTEVRKPDSY